MATFRLSFCDPFILDIIQLGVFSKEQALKKFAETDWDTYLTKMEGAKEGDIHYSPSLYFENTENKAGVEVSAVGKTGDNLFYIFYLAPVIKKKILGITYNSQGGDFDLQDQTKAQTLSAVTALLNEDYAALNTQFGK